MYAKYLLFKVIQVGNMNGIIVVIWKRLHIIEDDPVNNKYRKADNEFSRNRRNEKKRIENEHQYQLIGFVTDQHIGKQQVSQ